MSKSFGVIVAIALGYIQKSRSGYKHTNVPSKRLLWVRAARAVMSRVYSIRCAD